MQGGDSMSLGKVIRKYRKLRNMTQEEMAVRLGVTAPAVNKWENENSCPDIMLLAPIARLLEISLDTLLSFQKEITEEELQMFLAEAEQRLREQPYEEAFQWAKKKLEEYPNCEPLVLNFAVLFEAWSLVKDTASAEEQKETYQTYICSLYERLVGSRDETIRIKAADSLVGFYMRKKEYEKAEKYLEYFSVQNPEKKRKQAQIYAETGRNDEAYKAYEELLFADYQRVSLELHGMYLLALKEKDMSRAHMLTDRQTMLARCFDMGRYYEISCKLELAAMEKDTEAVLDVMEETLAAVGQIADFCKSPLYAHMDFKEITEESVETIKEELKKSFREEEMFGFLRENERWKKLMRL